MNNLLKILGVLAIVSLIICFILAALGMVGAVKIGEGCFQRYNDDPNSIGSVDRISRTIDLKANANYKMVSVLNSQGNIELKPDPNTYGQWLNTDIVLEKEQNLIFEIQGKISLCNAILPRNNLENQSNLDQDSKEIIIPRIDEDLNPILLKMPAKDNLWKNLLYWEKNDEIIVSVQKPNSTISRINPFNNKSESEDCAEGNINYSPMCSRYSIYSGNYVNICEYKENYYKCNFELLDRDGCKLKGVYDMNWTGPAGSRGPVKELCRRLEKCDDCGAWIGKTAKAPEPYRDDGYFTFKDNYNNIDQLFKNFNPECSYNQNSASTDVCLQNAMVNRNVKDKDYINSSSYQDNRGFWFTVDEKNSLVTGLVFKVDNDEMSSGKSIGSNYILAKISPDQSQYKQYNGNQIILQIAPSDTGFVKLKLFEGQSPQNNTGGYLIGIKQTACVGINGKVTSNVKYKNRGQVQYLILPVEKDPNDKNTNISPQIITPDGNGNANIESDKAGILWMRILNDDQDYKNSVGNYKVQFKTSQKMNQFAINILNPLMQKLKETVKNASKNIFQNMTCYNGDPNKNIYNATSCTNFFTYIQAMLVLYIILYGTTFLIGMHGINNKDFLIRILKISIVAGLINGKTFDLFNVLIFDTVMNFSDEIIANMSGYSLFSSSGKVSNPFMFMDSVLTKVFFSKTFMAQILALLSLGLSGLIYFVIIFIAVMILIITLTRAMAVYVMAFMFIAVLMGLAPIFLSFMLFDSTKYLFDNWVRFTVKYMLEPLILLAGIIILTQLFTIYLDIILGYSVCWKCTLPIRMPFVNIIPGMPAILKDTEIFCIYWFGPWGMDFRSGMLGINMQHMIALMMLAYAMYGYVELSGNITTQITGSSAAPSATSAGKAMSQKIENSVMKSQGMDDGTKQQIGDEKDSKKENRKEDVDKINKGSGSSKETPAESSKD